MSEHECTEHLLIQIDYLRTANWQLREYAEDAVAKIKRLEEAVDAAISFCEFHGPVGATPDTAFLIAKNLRKAKEAKP